MPKQGKKTKKVGSIFPILPSQPTENIVIEPIAVAKTVKKVTKTSTSPGPNNQTIIDYLIMSDVYEEENDLYEIVFADISMEKGEVRKLQFESYTIKEYSKKINGHEQHKKLIKDKVKNKKIMYINKAKDSLIPIEQPKSPMMEWIKEQRRHLRKDNSYIVPSIYDILSAYQKQYSVKQCCKDHINDVFKCPIVDVKFAMDFFIYCVRDYE